MTHERYKSSRKPEMAERLGTTREGEWNGPSAVGNAEDLRQVSEVKEREEVSAYEAKDRS
jgi:hypothetical protein